MTIMKEKEFKRLGRGELVEIIYELQQREHQLKEEIKELKSQLENRRIKIEDAGSIAEAALELSDVFLAAQNAADLYLEEVLNKKADMDEYSEKIISEAQQQADILTETAKQNCTIMLQQTEKEIKSQWSSFTKKVDEVMNARVEISSFINKTDDGVEQYE